MQDPHPLNDTKQPLRGDHDQFFRNVFTQDGSSTIDLNSRRCCKWCMLNHLAYRRQVQA